MFYKVGGFSMYKKNVIYIENSVERGNLIPWGLLDAEGDNDCAILYGYHFESENDRLYLVLEFEHCNFCFNKYYILDEDNEELIDILLKAKALRLTDGKADLDMLLQYIFSFKYERVNRLGHFIHSISIQDDSYMANIFAFNDIKNIFASIIDENFRLELKKGGN